jgi:signal transduction histidine kinase
VTPLCEQGRIACRLEISDLPRDVDLSSQTRHNVIMVVKEAIHNVIKHSKASEVHLHVSFEKGMLAIEIRDNGCGFDIAKHPAGNGLSNMKRRVAEMGGTWAIYSNANQGASVQVNLPIQKPHGNNGMVKT